MLVAVAVAEAFATIDTWAERYLLSADLAHKQAPPPLPERFATTQVPVCIAAPGRPPELVPAKRGDRLPRPKALRERKHRAKVLHAFWHHELQAAELMCWAALAFRDTPEEFRRGLMRICLDEIRHMRLYSEHLATLGFSIGDFPVRDWFWSRVPQCRDPIAFVAVMGMGLEAANLEHATAFAAHFRAAGDEVAACMQEQIGADEVAHVRFATRWFETWTGGCDFDAWLRALPPPWSPMVLRGDPLAIDARARAGMSAAFLQKLSAYVPEAKGRGS